MNKSLFPESTGAVFSPCEQYRYRLWRIWDSGRPTLTFVMLNPSTADETENDPTIERCVRRAVKLGYGGLQIVNIFALRSTDPEGLYEVDDPVGPDNDKAILAAVRESKTVICGWGGHGKYMDRGGAVKGLLLKTGITPYILVLNEDGTPRHPLYVAYAVQPEPWQP